MEAVSLMSTVDPRPTLHLPRGLPGSGKSTLARRLAAEGVVHVELDVFKRRLWPDVPPLYDPYAGRGLRVHLAWETAVLEALTAGRDVCADRTHLDPRAAARLRLLAPDVRVVVHDLTHVPLEVCIARDAGRPVGERIGEAGIRAMWQRWLAGTGQRDGRARASVLRLRQDRPEKAPVRPSGGRTRLRRPPRRANP